MRNVPAPYSGAALLLIDLQQAIDHPDWGVRNNPDAEANVAALLAHWRAQGWPIVHVRHDSTEAGSHYRPGTATHAFKPETEPMDGETVVVKSVNSAFVGTDLETRLKDGGHDRIVVAGVITNNSVEATVRSAGNLGFDVLLVEDACFTFSRKDWTGKFWPADDVHNLSLANMNGEYCTVISLFS